jgi:hypothetical protein
MKIIGMEVYGYQNGIHLPDVWQENAELRE